MEMRVFGTKCVFVNCDRAVLSLSERRKVDSYEQIIFADSLCCFLNLASFQ